MTNQSEGPQIVAGFPEKLRLCFEGNLPADVDQESVETLFVLVYALITRREGATWPEVTIPRDVFDEHGLSRPDLWEELWWPVSDYLASPNFKPDVGDHVLDLGPNDFIHLFERATFPALDYEEDPDNSDDDEVSVWLHTTVGSSDSDKVERLLDRLENDGQIVTRLIQALEVYERQGPSWASRQTLAALRDLQSRV